MAKNLVAGRFLFRHEGTNVSSMKLKFTIKLCASCLWAFVASFFNFCPAIRVAFAKAYACKNAEPATLYVSAPVAADLLNDRVLPIYERHDVKLARILTDQGTEYYAAREHHEVDHYDPFKLYLTVEDIDHSKTKSKSLQMYKLFMIYAICERFHQTIEDEFYATAFRKKLCR
jgi:hypothetical protein